MLDAKTGMLLWAAETLTLAALLLTCWLHNRTRHHHLAFAAGFAATGAGVALIALRGAIPDFISIQFANALALSAFAFWLHGLMRFDGRKADGWVFIPMLIWIAFMFVPPVRDSMAYRIVLYHSAAGLGFVMLTGVLLTGKGPISNTRRILACVLLLQAACGAMTAALVISSNLVTGSVVPLTLLTALSGALCFVVVIMVSAKMFMEDAEQRLHRLALTDYLTGSLNRRGLIEYVSTIRKKKKNPADGLALLLFDIDHFKKINDQYGHQAGDLVLVQFCTLANRIIEDDGVFARMGGEEFALILETSRLEKATTVAEAIRIYLARMPLVAGGMPIAVTVSVGVAFSGAEDADINQMMTIADRALYAAKKAGRNRTVVRDGDNNVVIAADDRPEDPSDNNADRQVAALNRIAAIAKT